MIEDIHDRVKDLRRTRKQAGLRGVWMARDTFNLAKEISEYLCSMEKVIGLKPSTPEVIHLALQEFKMNYGIMTSEEREEFINEVFKDENKK